ncbi:MAG: OsmC family protein, partial [Candidatus Bathyarchaeia archaeon]
MNLPDKLEYRVEAYWDGGTGGKVDLKVGKVGDVAFDRPREFWGRGSAPCPDQLFLTSLTGCLINTFLHFADRLEIEFVDVHSTASMKVNLVEHRVYSVKQINAVIRAWTDKEYANLV